MPNPGQLALPPTREGALRLGQELGAVLDALGIGGRTRFRAELVAEELFTNLIHHAGVTEPIELAVQHTPEGVVLQVCDRGRPFDPRGMAPRADRDAAAQASAGGFGIDLIRKSTARLDYVSHPDGRNVLTALLLP